jgi:mannose/fructose-specific phosphotransferase system component IIA
MSDLLTGVVISHGDVAGALVRAVKEITGDDGGLVPISNTGAGRDRLCGDIAAAVGVDSAVVFVDMPGGSCLHATLLELRARSNVAVVAGVNLPMLLDFVFHRDLAPDQAAERAIDAATRSVRALSV